MALSVLKTDRGQTEAEERNLAHVILVGSLREMAFEMAFKSLDQLKKENSS